MLITKFHAFSHAKAKETPFCLHLQKTTVCVCVCVCACVCVCERERERLRSAQYLRMRVVVLSTGVYVEKCL